MSSNLICQGIIGSSKTLTITYITELPPSKKKELCDHCDQIGVWTQMASTMGFSDTDVNAIKRRLRIPEISPTNELLKIWGGQYNHKIVELFGVFHKLKIFQGMRIIKDYVPPEYRLLIPISIPHISKMLFTNTKSNGHTVKLQNKPIVTSSGVETTSTSTIITTDNNNSSSSFNNNNYDRSRSAIHPSRQNGLTNSSMANLQEITNIMPEIDYHELTEATNNWDKSLILGKGGFGTVYRGYWKHTDVAIKQIDYRGVGGQEGAKVQLGQSLNELKHLYKYRHDNILPLYGYCIKGDKPCLVYQLMKGGSLEQRLNTNKFQPLTWQQRIDICLGTARGIYYLHSLRSDKPLIHGDIKPGNVLLDQCLQPKIGDFGLAMEGPNAINRAVQVSQVFGTRAYLPPEFLNSKRLSTQVDTFSFGVVLLETFTGLRAIDKNRNLLTKTIINLLEANNNNIVELIDKRMLLSQPAEEMNHNDKLQTVQDCDKVNGLIHLDNTCYQIECLAGSKVKHQSTESMPSIRAIRGSFCAKNSHYSLIAKTAKMLGFKLVKENQFWNILWMDGWPTIELYKNMKRFQQINHYPDMAELCRKDLLSRNLNRMLKLYPQDYRIFPKTWIFPADYGEAITYANNVGKQKMFILKPDSGAQGRGIWLTSDLKNISPTDRMICQRYVENPLLIDGYKFDLRVYVLITSVDPLRIFVYNEGLVRLATTKYVEPSEGNSSDLYMHLTNYSVNRRNSQYEICEDDDCGSKRNFTALNNWMRTQNYDVKEFWLNIDDIIIKTVLSAWPVLKHSYHACFPAHDKIQACFEILGFDILVNSKLKPYVLEVNHSPSLHTNECVDSQVKTPLIRDTLSLIGTVLADKRQILREDRKRIKQRLLKYKLGNISGSSKPTKNSPPQEKVSHEQITECPVSALAQQIAWEESHLGNYRRIMPPNNPIQLNYYCKFYEQRNQLSIFAKTLACKKREEVSKKLRQELEEKRAKQTEMLRRKLTAVNFEERQRKRAAKSRSTIERQRLEMLRSQAHWSPGYISLEEERLRAANMQLRADTIKELKICETIYETFYNLDILTNTDIKKFPHFYRSLEGGIKM